MRGRDELVSFIKWLMVVILFLGGLFCMGLPQSPVLKQKVLHFLIEDDGGLRGLGVILFFLGIATLFGFYSLERIYSYKVQMKFHEATVDLPVIRGYLERYWAEKFPEKGLKTDVAVCSENQFEFILEIPSLPDIEHRTFLVKTEAELGAILFRIFGYRKEFFTTFVIRPLA